MAGIVAGIAVDVVCGMVAGVVGGIAVSILAGTDDGIGKSKVNEVGISKQSLAF